MSSSVLVIGGGVVGAAVALRCVMKGASVTLLDAGFREQSATRASLAWINANRKTPREYFDLNVAGMREYAELGDRFTDLTQTRLAGNTEWAITESAKLALREKVERLRSWGYAAELLPIAELKKIEPDMAAPESVEEFGWFPEEGYVEPVELTGRMLDLAVELGATVMPKVEVRRLIVEGGRVSGVETTAGKQLQADVVGVCAGRWSADVLASAEVTLPMDSRVGMVALSEPGPDSLRSLHHDELLQIRPAGNGRVLMRHEDFDERVVLGEEVSAQLLDELRDRVAAILPGMADRGIEWSRTAARPIPADGFPAVGWIRGIDGLYVVVTHSGITLGPLLGRIAAAEMLDAKESPLLGPFRPERLLGASV